MKKQKWQKELDVFSGVKTTFILENNIHDIFAWEECGSLTFLPLDEYLYRHLKSQGYHDVIYYDPIFGFHNRFDSNDDIKQKLTRCGIVVDGYREQYNDYLGQTIRPESILAACETVKDILLNYNSVAMVMNYASGFCVSPDSLAEDERLLYMNLHYASLNSREIFIEGIGLRRNLLYLITDKINDIPTWFCMNNPNQVTISIPLPDKMARECYVTYIENEFPGFIEAAASEKEIFISDISWLTEGMSCREINGLKTLCQKEKANMKNIRDEITLYKIGIKENPWSAISREVLVNAEATIKESIKGQESAVRKVVDIVKRAATGLSGLHHSNLSQKPRGVMFFVGPTGVGKTETVKTLARLLFGTEDAVIRFDMSEYGQAHSDQKLFGAPPGYVGYEAGGQLTEAVRNKPFSILLFDEIEKAHPTILDKFLQILDDGRLTDGHGNVTYFSETIIIFTSNLGIYKTNQNGEYIVDQDGNRIPNVTPNDSYEVFKNNINNALNNHMRPEFLGKMGDNVIYFKYVDENVTNEILEEKLLPRVNNAIKEKTGVDVEITPSAKEELLKVTKRNLKSGARGIGNVLETYELNPIARTIVDENLSHGDCIRINGFKVEEDVVYIERE